MEQVRVQKYLSDCGLMSRRSAEKEIENGSVTVNGEPAHLGQKITVGRDIVKYKGKQVRRTRKHHVYIMLNKPKGYVTTLSDDKGRPCVAELLHGVKTRVYPIGRLDMASEGLLLLTDDGGFANRMMHPRHKIPKIYRVKAAGTVNPSVVERLCSPMVIDGYRTVPAQCELISSEENKHTLSVTLWEGRNRQIRKMFEQVGLRVTSLKRIAIGNLTLDHLPRGRWRYLNEEEIEYLTGDETYADNTAD